MPKHYHAFLVDAGIFGLADFSPTLMILSATNLPEGSLGIIEASRMTVLLRILRNVVCTAASHPFGAPGDRFSRSRFMAVGYGVAVAAFLGFEFNPPAIECLASCFGLSGIISPGKTPSEAQRRAITSTRRRPGTVLGGLGAVSDVGDLVSSLSVGLLWTTRGALSPAVVVGLAGAMRMVTMRSAKRQAQT